MEIYSIITTVLTLIAGGGWFIFYRENKKIKAGEATSSEAKGWQDMQDLYQKTIEDFKGYSEDMRQERAVLKKENSELYERYKKLDEEMIQIKRRLSRQGRKIEALSPFLCSVVGCMKRKRVNLGALQTDDENNEGNEDTNNDNEETKES